MVTIEADFNALTGSGAVRLTTRAAAAGVARFGVRPGDRVTLTDGDLGVEAVVSEDAGRLVAVPDAATWADRPAR